MKSTHVQGGIYIKWKEKVSLLERLVFVEQLNGIVSLISPNRSFQEYEQRVMG